MDRDKMAEGIRLFVEGIGQRFEGDDLERTPERVARAWVDDLTSGYAVDAESELTWTTTPSGAGPVVVRGISVASICVHHLLPFHGLASVAYLPGERMAGLSKLGRVVDAHARRLQTQERLTAEIAATIDRVLKPHGVAVRLEAEHTCMTLRGVRKEQSGMMTVATRGCYETDPTLRGEVLSLLADPGPSRFRR